MKLIFTQDALVNAGAERSHLEILSRFSEDTQVAMVYFYPKHELKEAYERAGIRLFFLDIPESYHFPQAISRLVRLIRAEKPDLLVSSLWRADIITRMASLITGVPLVGTLVNDSYSPIAWTDKKGLKYKMVYWLDRITSKIPVHWIANAQALADSHVKTLGLSRDKISVVYRGRPVIAPARRGGSEARAKQSHNEYSLPPRSVPASPRLVSPLTETSFKNFITYGRLLERKGFQDAIQAFSQILQTYPDCTLTIFGEGPYRKDLEKLIQNLGLQESVFLPGKIPNPMEMLISGYSLLPTSTKLNTGTVSSDCQLSTENCPLNTAHCHLTTAHCFLFPSWYEGFSGALVEAMMAGIPIIASDIPMNLEAITDKKTGLIFKLRDIEDLAQKIKFAIQNPDLMNALGQEARKEAVERFDIEKIAKEYESVLRGILPLPRSVPASPIGGSPQTETGE